MTTVMKWAFVGDLQIPYHDKRAVSLWMKVMKKWKPDAIDFVGDIDDQLEYSRFSDGTTDEAFNALKALEKQYEKDLMAYDRALLKRATAKDPDSVEVPEQPIEPDLSPISIVRANSEAAKSFYTDVRADHPDADMHSSLGNHDIRIFDYMDRKAPEYADQVTPNVLWGLDDLGITWRQYDLPPFERFARIHVHHGATTTTTGLAVKNDIETYNISLVRGHDHRGGVVYKSYPMTGGSLAGMGTGHLCDPNGYGLSYTINPSWEKGFGIAYVVDGKAHLQFIPMRDYTVVLDGKIFKG
jgi:hypothetical protein